MLKGLTNNLAQASVLAMVATAWACLVDGAVVPVLRGTWGCSVSTDTSVTLAAAMCAWLVALALAWPACFLVGAGRFWGLVAAGSPGGSLLHVANAPVRVLAGGLPRRVGWMPLVLAAFVAAGAAAVLPVVESRLTPRFDQADDVAAAVVLAGGVIVFLLVHRAAAFLALKGAPPPVLMVAEASAYTSLAVGPLWRVLPSSRASLSVGWLLLALATCACVLIRWRPLAGWMRHHRHGLCTASVALAAACMVGLPALLIPRPWLVAQLMDNTTVGAGSLELLSVLGDGDGDGYAGWPTGVDCDDANPGVHPGALELVGNGVDENCTGEDLAAPAAECATLVPQRTEAMPVPAPARNVLIITVDALRADVLGATLHGQPVAPNLDALASHSVVFQRNYSAAPYTSGGLDSFFTGLFQSGYELYGLELGRHAGLGRVLRPAGFTTRRLVMADDDGGEPENLGEFEGVEALRLPREKRATTATAPEATRWLVEQLRLLRSQPRRFALSAHYFDPHAVYLSHPATADWGEDARSRYLQEVHFADEGIGQVLRALEDTGLAADTVVVVTADHGESLGEHGRKTHVWSLQEEVIRTPLLVSVPGLSHAEVDAVTRSVDVLPTIVDLLGVDVGGRALWDGHSLVPLMMNRPEEPRTAFVEARYRGEQDLLGMVTHSHKLLWDRRTGGITLRGLPVTPQGCNVAADESRVLQQMAATLARYWDCRSNNLAFRSGLAAAWAGSPLDAALP